MNIVKNVKLDLSGNSAWDTEFTARWLQTYANEMIPYYTKKMLRSLGYRERTTAERAYAKTVKYDKMHPLIPTTVDYNVSGNKLTITASGPEVGFSEFGAGFFADPGHELAGNATALGIDVYPGSWSLGPEGYGHFSETDAAHPPGPIPLEKWWFNVIPGRGMLAAWDDIKYIYRAMAEAAFQYDVGLEDD